MLLCSVVIQTLAQAHPARFSREADFFAAALSGVPRSKHGQYVAGWGIFHNWSGAPFYTFF